MISFRVISSIIIDKFAMLLHEKIENVIDMSRVCIIKRPRALDRFLNRVKWHSQVIWMFTTFREHCLLPEKQKRSHCSFMHTNEEKTLLPLQMRRYGPIIWVERNWTSFDICTRFYLSTPPSQTRVMEFIIINICFYMETRLNQSVCIYKYHQGNLTRDQRNHNKAMSEVWPTVLMK